MKQAKSRSKKTPTDKTQHHPSQDQQQAQAEDTHHVEPGPPQEDTRENESADTTGDSLNIQVSRLEEKLLRAKADYQNLQRQAMREKSDAIRFANAGLMKSLLSVLDDFQRSIESAEQGHDVRAVVEGVKLVQQNLEKALRDHGLSTINAAGETFDPQIHEAMMEQPTDQVNAGDVVSEIAKGYKLFDRVIRPSKVIVAKEPDTKEDQN